MISFSGNVVEGNFIIYNYFSLTIHGKHYLQAPDLSDGMTAGLQLINQIDSAIAVTFQAGAPRIDHILMPTRSFALFNNAGMLSLRRVSMYGSEFVEGISIPNVGYKEFNTVTIPIPFAMATLLVFVIPDDLYDLINTGGKEYLFVESPYILDYPITAVSTNS